MNRKTGAVLSYVYMIFEVLSTLLLTPLIIRVLGDAEYGVYKLIAAVTAYLLLLDLGMGNAVVRYIAKYKEQNDVESSRKFFGVCLVFYAAVSVVVLILGGCLIAFFRELFSTGLSEAEIVLGKKLLALTVVNAAITLATSVFHNIILAHSRFVVAKGSAIVQIVLRISLTAVALMLGYGSVAVVTVQLVLNAAVRLFYAVYVLGVMKLRPRFKGADTAFVKDIIVYSAFILMQMIATQINACADQVLLGMFVTSSAAMIGIYGVGTQIVQYFQSIGQALGGILMPGVVRLVESGADAKRLQQEMIRIGRYSLSILGILFVGFLVNGKTFLLLWVGQGYDQSYYVALMLMFAYMLILSEGIGTQILWAMNKHRSQSVIKLLIVLANIVLTIFLMRWKPLIGAAIGTFVSLMLGDVLSMNIVFRKEIGVSLKAYYAGLFKGIVPCMILSAASGWAVSLLNVTGLPGILLNIAVMTLVYGGTMWGFGFHKSEKDMLLGWIRKKAKAPRS